MALEYSGILDRLSGILDILGQIKWNFGHLGTN